MPRTLERVHVPQLPLRSRVVFVDWHGVLSRNVFWSSILSNPKHRLHRQLRAAMALLFDSENSLLTDWIRGRRSYHDVVRWLVDEMDVKADPQFLARRLLRDCRKVTVSQSLIAELQSMRRDCYLVVATDNMDCFKDTLDDISEVRDTFDAAICSSEIGLTKQDSIVQFFQPWLNQYALSFSDAVLIDDRQENCRRFVEAGGTAIVFREVEDTVVVLGAWHREHRAADAFDESMPTTLLPNFGIGLRD